MVLYPLIVCLVFSLIFFLLSLFLTVISKEPATDGEADGVVRSILESDSSGGVCYRIDFIDDKDHMATAESIYYSSACPILHEGTPVRIRYYHSKARYPGAMIDSPDFGQARDVKSRKRVPRIFRIVSAGFVLLGIFLFVKANFLH